MPPIPTSLSDAIPELAPELSAEQFASTGWVWWLLVVLCVILVGAGVYLYLYRRRTQAELSPVSPVQQVIHRHANVRIRISVCGSP